MFLVHVASYATYGASFASRVPSLEDENDTTLMLLKILLQGEEFCLIGLEVPFLTASFQRLARLAFKPCVFGFELLIVRQQRRRLCR